MTILRTTAIVISLFFVNLVYITAQDEKKAVPVFENGEAQIVPAFNDPEKWIRHDLWVETTFDTDGDGKKDSMLVAVTRPEQTQSEELKLPVV